METRHYLGFHSPFGAAFRHVAGLPGGEWAALIGWSSGAFKVGARERWLGWLPEQQFRRRHLIASNTQFLVLPGFRVQNLASRVLGLSARRLSSDMEALQEHPVLLAETFVDPAMFVGTCYRAAGWQEIGETRGFGRDAGGWRDMAARRRFWRTRCALARQRRWAGWTSRRPGAAGRRRCRRRVGCAECRTLGQTRIRELGGVATSTPPAVSSHIFLLHRAEIGRIRASIGSARP